MSCTMMMQQSLALPARVSRRSASVAAAPAAARRAAVRPRAARLQVAASATEEKAAPFSLPAAAMTLATVLSQASAAEAAVSPSLKNLLLSVLAGGSVLVVIAVAVVGVSSFDKTARKD